MVRELIFGICSNFGKFSGLNKITFGDGSGTSKSRRFSKGNFYFENSLKVKFYRCGTNICFAETCIYDFGSTNIFPSRPQ